MHFLTGAAILSTLLSNFANAQDSSIHCPGVIHANPSSTVCCVGGTLAPLSLSSCAGWPSCTGPVTLTTTSKPLSCATVIDVSTSNYASLITAANQSLAESGTNYRTTFGIASATDTSETSIPASTSTTIVSPTSGPSSTTRSSQTTTPNLATSTAGSGQITSQIEFVYGVFILVLGLL